MPKLSKEQLYNELAKIYHMTSKTYRHYKGGLYEVTGVTVDADTNDILLTYRTLDWWIEDRDIYFSRPLSQWFDVMDDLGTTRFTKVIKTEMYMSEEEISAFRGDRNAVV